MPQKLTKVLSFFKELSKKLKKRYIGSINNIFINLGGINTKFDLNGYLIEFAIMKPHKLNINYLLFGYFKNNFLFIKLFRLILMVPHFFTETLLGSLFLSSCIGWALVGRELITVFLAGSFVFEVFFLTFYLSYFLRLEGIYAYCIQQYGSLFVRKYIDNPFTSAQLKLGTKAAAAGTVFLGADQLDRHRCSVGTSNQAQKIYEMHQANGSKLSKNDINNIWSTARSNHIPRTDAFSDAIKSAISNKK